MQVAGAQPAGPVHVLALTQLPEPGPRYPGPVPDVSTGVLLARTALGLSGGSESSPGGGGELLCQGERQ